MASVSTPRPKFYKPNPPADFASTRVQTAVVGVCLAVLLIAALPQSAPKIVIACIVCLFSWAWTVHLQYSLLPPKWSSALSLLLASQWLAPMWRENATFVFNHPILFVPGFATYMMIWALSMRNTRRELQAIASIALLLPITLFAGPTLLFSAVFVAFVLLIGSRRKFGGHFEAVLLLFTPVILCFVVTYAMRRLGISAIRFPEPHFDIHQILSWHFMDFGKTKPELAALLPATVFALAALISRLLCRRANAIDLSFICLTICLFAGMILTHTPANPMVMQLKMVACGGGMALFAVGPPTTNLSRTTALLMTFAALVVRLS